MVPRPNTSDSKPFYRRSTIDNTNLDKFKYLHKNVLNKESSGIASPSEVVDALKQLAEYLIWEDKNNQDAIFEYFCEENIMDYMTGVLCRSSSRAIRIQLVQTISMLIHNITNKRTLYYLLSNNYINGLITVPEMYAGGDVSSWTISLLKTLSSILNKSTIKFFFLQKNEVFPLLDKSLIFLNNHDSMKRAHVMTIILNIFKVKDDDVVDYIIHKSKILLQLVLYLKYCWYRLNKYINKYYKFDENILIECDDILCFIEELMDLEIVSINQKLVYYIFNICFIPLIKKILRRSSVNLMTLNSLSVPSRVDLEYLSNVYYQLSSSVGLAHLYITNKTNLYNNFSDASTNNEQLLTEPLLNDHTEEEYEDNRDDKENEDNEEKDYNKLEETMKVELDENDDANEIVNNVIYYIIVNVLINCRRKELLKPLLLMFFSPFISRRLLVQLGGGSRSSSMFTTPMRTPTSNKNEEDRDNKDNEEDNRNKEKEVYEEEKEKENNEEDKEKDNRDDKINKKEKEDNKLGEMTSVELDIDGYKDENDNVEKEELFTSSTRTFVINQENINAYYSLLRFSEYYDMVTDDMYNNYDKDVEDRDNNKEDNEDNRNDTRNNKNKEDNQDNREKEVYEEEKEKENNEDKEDNQENKERSKEEHIKAGEMTPRFLLDDDCVVNVVMGVFIYDGLSSLKVRVSKLLMLLKLLLHYQLQLVKLDNYNNVNITSNSNTNTPISKSDRENKNNEEDNREKDYEYEEPMKVELDENDNSSSRCEMRGREYGYQKFRSNTNMMKELMGVRSLLSNNNIYLQIFNSICLNVTNYKLNVVLLRLYNSLLEGYINNFSSSNNNKDNKEEEDKVETKEKEYNEKENAKDNRDDKRNKKEKEDNKLDKNKEDNNIMVNRKIKKCDKKHMMVEQQLQDELRFHLDIIYNIIRLYVLNSIESTTLFYLSVFYNEWIKYVKLNYTNIHNLIHYNDILPLPNEEDNEFNLKLDERENPLNKHISEQMDKNTKEMEKKPQKLLKERQKEKLMKRLFSRGNKNIKITNTTMNNKSNIGQEEFKHSPINIFKRYIQILLLFKELYNIINKDNSKSLNDKVYLKSIEDASLYLYEACPLFYNHLEMLLLGNKQIKLGNLMRLSNLDGVRYYKCIIRNNNDQRERVFIVNDIFFILAKIKVRREHRHERKEVRREYNEEDKVDNKDIDKEKEDKDYENIDNNNKEENEKDYRDDKDEDISSTLQNLLLGDSRETSKYKPVTNEDFVLKEEVKDNSNKEKEVYEEEKEKENNEEDKDQYKQNKESRTKEEHNKGLALEITCVHFLWNCLVKKVDKANFKFNILISWHPNFKSLTPSHYFSNSNNKWNDPITPIVSEFEIIFNSLQDLNSVIKLHNNNKKNLSSTCLLSLQDYLYN